ncbi:hypothetical protein BASA60_009734 [Batrachochytrium salamandrivorans]|nr:hypothetical protein BASA60_009734 [Batrachochytrium salamandrivorans]
MNNQDYVSWADALPKQQGLYCPQQEKDACGVGFICHIKGVAHHSIVADAQSILCNMTHRGAVGADSRDGDGAGLMCAIPHAFLEQQVLDLYVSGTPNPARPLVPPPPRRHLASTEPEIHHTSLHPHHHSDSDLHDPTSDTDASTVPPLPIQLPRPGQYAVGNIYFSPDAQTRFQSIAQFEQIARDLGLMVLCWRTVPTNSTILGPVARSKEPVIMQPFVVLADDSALPAATSFASTSSPASSAPLLQSRLRLHLPTLPMTLSLPVNCLLSPVQLYPYFPDLANPAFSSHFCLVHSRFSTNTFPSWDRAQPMRLCAHNGEINTLRGNKNWMRAREGILKSERFGSQLESMYPIIEEGGSDSAAFDNVLELLVMNGVLTLPEAIMVMIPEAWQNQPDMDPAKRAFYEWAACLMEPWDGPALFTFSDGRYVGASLDRNGLRPCRFYITDKDMMICASEVGTIPVAAESIVSKGRLQPGKMLLVDTLQGRVVDDQELKTTISAKRHFGQWVKDYTFTMSEIRQWVKETGKPSTHVLDSLSVKDDKRMLAFGFTLEQLSMIIMPMALDGKEPLGSMGTDTPLACLSHSPCVIYEYFRELFAQVTNPPIDPIREDIVMSLSCYIGPQGNILELEPTQCHRIRLPSPILSIHDLEAIKDLQRFKPNWAVAVIDITFEKVEGVLGYTRSLDRVCAQVSLAIQEGVKIVVLSDTAVSVDRVPLSALVALGAVHHHLVRNKQRSKIALVVETGEARQVHHFCVLLGYGADAICPYLAFETMQKLRRDGLIHNRPDLTDTHISANFIKASNDGIKKVMSKMGISTLQSYKGAQIFEALGIDRGVISRCFSGTASRIRGVGFRILALDVLAFHDKAWPMRSTVSFETLPEAGEYHWRQGGEKHINDPVSIAALQDAVRRDLPSAYDIYAQQAHEQIKHCTLRGLLDFNYGIAKPIPIDSVEPWTSIVKRFCTGAMSYGSISIESHSALAIAMNRLGGKSNTGEGGEDMVRSVPLGNGDLMRSAIKQIASGRFGVTSFYLSDSDEIQIKMAQGAKPGEGGELPGYKVTKGIANTRKSTPGVGLISPPPHHDIYSIEDLKQLIYDLECANPTARISVKLVSEVGVGIIASGVAKANAGHILISGHDGGTGASRLTGIKSAGLPWELGLAETHQTLVLNNLRGRVTLQTDGQIKTGRDVAIACMLGAEEWGFATTPLIAMGCTMMRKCHLNTCPVGIATQDPELRKKFKGTPENVVNFFHFVAEHCRSIMAQLGFRTIEEMVGRADMLMVNESLRNPKTANLDLSPILTPAFDLRPGAATHKMPNVSGDVRAPRLDSRFIEQAQPALIKRQRTVLRADIINTDRTIGTTLSYHVSRIFAEAGLPAGSIHLQLKGSAGQSLGAFLAPGILLELEGDANDYVGKGLSGGHIVVYPPKVSTFASELNVIVGNVCLYGATSGKAFFRGIAAERFCVRNSAGMSGGIAYILDLEGKFRSRCNTEMVDLESVNNQTEIDWLKGVIDEHRICTGSAIALKCLTSWCDILPKFVKVMPRDYRAVLEALEKEKTVSTTSAVIKSLPLPSEPSLGDIEDGVLDEAAIAKRVQTIDKVRGFMKYHRKGDAYRNPEKRAKDWKEVNSRLTKNELKVQAARCMDCGVPFCQSDMGCPIGNIIPKWNDLVFNDQWRDALDRLLMTNNFPEFTGRVCPAPCEGACVLGINELPVSIKSIECAIIDRAFDEGWMAPRPPQIRTGKRVAIIGSGPAGLAAADQLNKAGHVVTVYDRNDRHGGLLMYGIPNMKLEKRIVQRRIDLLADEGVVFIANAHVGKDIHPAQILGANDAMLLTVGATWPRDLPIPNRNLDGIHFAMEFLQRNTKSLMDSSLKDGAYLNAKGKNVIVIGGGDTGNDCIGTALRHGAKSITNFELMPQPPDHRSESNPWPEFPRVFRVDYGHAEAASIYGKDPRQYSVLSKEFVSNGLGHVKGINTIRVKWIRTKKGGWSMQEVPGTEEFYPADLVLLSMGFLGPEKELLQQLNVQQDMRSNISTVALGNDHSTGAHHSVSYATSVSNVFAAGDCRRGQSLIVWGINEGRQAARQMDLFLMGNTRLPVSGGIEKRAVERLKAGHIPPVVAGAGLNLSVHG